MNYYKCLYLDEQKKDEVPIVKCELRKDKPETVKMDLDYFSQKFTNLKLVIIFTVNVVM